MPNTGLVVAPLKHRSGGNQVNADPFVNAIDNQKPPWGEKDLQGTTHPLATKAQYFKDLSREELKAFAIGSSASLAFTIILIGAYCCVCSPRVDDEGDNKDSPDYLKLRDELEKTKASLSEVQESMLGAQEERKKQKEDWAKESRDKEKLLEAKTMESKQMSNRLAALDKGKEEWALQEDLLMKSSRDKDKLLEAKCAEVKQMSSALEKAKEQWALREELLAKEKKDLEGKFAEAEKMSDRLTESTKREEHLERELAEYRKWNTMPDMPVRAATPEDLESLFAKPKRKSKASDARNDSR